MTWVATEQDLYLGGLSPEACRPDALEVASVTLAGSIFEIPGNGFGGGELVRFASRTGAVPSPIVATTYYPVNVPSDPDFFTLVGVTLTDIGSGVLVLVENVIPKIRIIMARVTSYVVASAVAYKAPWTTPPAWAPLLVAQLAAPKVCAMLRIAPARYDVKQVQEDAANAERLVNDVLRAGQLLNDGTGPIDANDPAPDNAALAEADRTPTCWRTGAL